MDPFADAIALLSLVGSGITFWLGRREGRKRKLWEEEQEKRQIAFTQPDLVPTGGRYEGIFSRSGEPMRFSPAGEHVIPLHNEGGSTPSQVVAVLFPSEWYWKPTAGEESPHKVDLYGTYWAGALDLSPAANERIEMRMECRRFPLTGDLSVLPGLQLFAPPEPDMGAVMAGVGVFYSARLTITYRDREGRTLGAAFDLHAAEPHRWQRRAGPVVVARGLTDLSDEATVQRAPPKYAPEPIQRVGE